MPSVAVVEPNPYGHRLEFCNLLLGQFVALGVTPRLITSPEATASDQFRCFISPLESRIVVEPRLTSDDGTCWSRYQYLSGMLRCLTDRTIDFLYIPDAALVAYLTSSLRSVLKFARSKAWIEGLVLGGQFGYFPAAKSLRSRLTEFQLKRNIFNQLFHLDPFQEMHLTRIVKNISLMPDPVGSCATFDKRSARSILGLPEMDYLIGSCGTIEFSKGHDLLAASFARSITRLPSGSRLVFAGKMSPTFFDHLKTTCGELLKTGRIILLDRFLSATEIDAAIQSLDVNVVPYRKAYQSSGILLRCLHTRRNLVATNKGWIGRTLDFVNYGLRIDIDNPTEFDLALQTPHSQSNYHEAELANLLRFHSPENFQATWTRNFCEKAMIQQIHSYYPYPNTICHTQNSLHR